VGDYACDGGTSICQLGGPIADCTFDGASYPAPCLATRAVMGSSEQPATAGQPVIVWATVLAHYPVVGTPGGTFQFRLNGQPLGSPVALDSHGRAHLTLYLRPGIHWITGRYPGDGTFAASVAVRLYQFVQP
jgi:hypothetical protein